MKWCTVALLLLQLSQRSCSRSVEPEESVVSVYTTQPNSGTSPPGDVYRQIANNIAERITSPIYRFLGIGKNKTETVTKKPWDKIETFDDSEEVTKVDVKPVSNGIDDRDVEELSVEALKKTDKKPEKITLFSSYLPTANIELQNDTVNTEHQNDTVNEIDEPFEFNDDDDDDIDNPDQGGFWNFFDLVGTLLQLALGAFLALFKSSSSN